MNNDFIITKINRIILVDKDEYLEEETSFLHDLDYNELIFHISGSCTVKFNGKTLHCDAGSLRFLPKCKNREYTVTRKEYGECIDIFFETDKPVSDEAFCQKINNNEAVKNLFKKIFTLWVSKNDGYYFECVSLLYKIFAELQKQNYISGKQYKTIKLAISYIEDNFLTEKISVESLAKMCGISDSYLKKLFIKCFGISPVKYIIQMKINYASDLLRSGLYSLEQIAKMCNYDNYYYFSRQFKQYSGTSPKKFLNEYKSSK